MKKTASRMLTRPGFWAATALQLVATAQLWVALQVVLDPGSSFREHLWPGAVVFAVAFTVFTLLYPLFARGVLKDDDGLSDEQTAALEQALRTGALPLVSLFADWGPALNKRRRDLESGRWVGPILIAGVIALNIYDSLVDPDGVWFYWISALFYAVLGVTGEVTARQRLWRVRALEHQLEERRGGVPGPG
jgi:hypothetical protein